MPAAAAATATPRRVLLKLSGEALMGEHEYGIDPGVVREIAGQVAEAARATAPRSRSSSAAATSSAAWRPARGAWTASTGDYMGMLATVMNGLAIQDALEQSGCPTRVMSAIAMNEICEPYIRRRAVRHLEKGRVVVMVAGTGNPYFTTDTAATLRAVEVHAQVILKATRVDGVYDADPETHPNAQRYSQIGYTELLSNRLQALDATAVSLAMDNEMPIVVFDMTVPGNIARAIARRADRHADLRRRDPMTHEALTAIEPKMQRAIDAMERDFSGIRTGRASTALVERITVDYYGAQTPLNQVAGISTPDPHLIVIQPWDRSVLSAIEKAITKSDIGLMPNVDGTVVRLNVPPLTEERRKEMVKQVRRRTEEARVEVRNHRREAADQLKKALRDGDLSEDEERRELESLQKLTDRHIEAIDARADRKEAEILEV